MAYEDLTTYTEVDPNGVWTQTTTRNTVVAIPRTGDDSYVYKDYGTNHFGNYKCLIDVRFTSMENTSNVGFWAITDNPASNEDLINGQAAFCYAFGVDTPHYYISDSGTGNSDYWTGGSINTTYYFVMERSGTTFTCEIYSDPERTNLLHILSITCGNTKRKYAMVGFSRDAVGGVPQVASGYCENFDIQRFHLVPSALLAEDLLGGVWDW